MATCRGIDVSAYQAAQDWAAHKAEGVVFAFAKASEGQHTHDSRFVAHIKAIKAAGLVPGAYHFAHPNQDATAEAANYIAAVKAYAGKGFTHWLDLERLSDGSNYAGRTSAQIKAYAVTWIAAVEKAFPGQRVGVYTAASDITAGHVPTGVPLWYPAYPWGAAAYSKAEAAAQPRPGGRAPLFWQFTSTPLDRSICYLTAAQLRTWAAGENTPEDDMPLTPADVKTLATTDNVFKAPEDAADIKTNKFWTLASHVQDQTQRIRDTQKTINAMSATVKTLAGLAGANVDTDAVVAAVRTAIADAVVKVDVDVNGTPS